MNNLVMQALVLARIQDATTAFGKWCVVHGIRSLPASPLHVATFVTECGAALTPVETIWRMVREISEAHIAEGHADPTAGGPVARAMNSVSKIGPPQSWPKEQWPRFFDLPFDLQQYLLEREKERRRVVGRAFNEAAKARQELAAIQKLEEQADGIQQDSAASGADQIDLRGGRGSSRSQSRRDQETVRQSADHMDPSRPGEQDGPLSLQAGAGNH